MNRILILQRTFEHYRIPVFSELATRKNIDLTIAFPYAGRLNSPYADIDLQYQHIDLEINHYSFPIVGEIFKYKNLLDVISGPYFVARKNGFQNDSVLNISKFLSNCFWLCS